MTKQITVPSDGKLSFWYRAETEGYPVAFEVNLSTGSQTDPSSYTTLLWDSGMFDNEAYTKQVIDLSAYADLDVYIGFHFYSAFDPWWGFYLDDVNVFSSLVYSDNEIISSLSPGEEEYVEFDPWTTDVGMYLINVSTKLIGDEYPANDYRENPIRIAEFPDIRVEPDQLELECPEYETPPLNLVSPSYHKNTSSLENIYLEPTDDKLPSGIKILEWMGPHDFFDDYIGEREVTQLSVEEIGGLLGDPTDPTIVVFITSGLKPESLSILSVMKT